MSAWIGIIGTVIGAIVGGGLALLNAHLQTRRQVQQERRKLILSKLEELHEAISYYRREHQENLLLVLTMPEGPNSETSQESKERRNLSMERIQMLVGFYAPELSKYLEKIMRETVSHMKTVVAYTAAKRLGEARDKDTTDSLWSTREELDGALTLMQMELENVAKKYM
jgi:gas vesicle protein